MSYDNPTIYIDTSTLRPHLQQETHSRLLDAKLRNPVIFLNIKALLFFSTEKVFKGAKVEKTGMKVPKAGATCERLSSNIGRQSEEEK